MKQNYKLLLKKILGLIVLAIMPSLTVKAQLVVQTFSYTGTIQTFTVPQCAYQLTIEARGAQGGDNVTLSGMGGRGAQMIGTFTSTPGQVLNIVVGQRGANNTGGNANNGAGGGGGGSFVWVQGQTVPLIVAGGGGGSALVNNGLPNYLGKDASITTTATGSRSHDVFSNSPGGVNGASGTSVCGSGGKGWTAVLANPAGNPAGNVTYGAAGGYGGGGGAGTAPNAGNSLHTGGGGGGYSGGGAGGTDYYHGGGGGGSYNAGTNQVNTGTVQTGDGIVYIRYIPGSLVNVVSSPTAICSGGSATLTASGVSSYTWVPLGGNGTTLVVNPTTTTSYTVMGTNSLGCTSPGVITVTVSTGLPVLSISNPSSNICLGRTVSLTATGALTHTWANPGVVNGQTFTPNATAVYTVTGTNGCGSTTGTTSIVVAPLPVSVLASPSLVCEGYGSTLTAVSSVGNYTWLPGPLPGATVVVAPMANTVYTVTATDGTCSGVASLTVNTKTTPTITASSTSTRICEGATVSLTAGGAGIGGTYSWTPAGGTNTTIVMTPQTNTLFVVYGTNSLNCTASANQVVIVDAAPAMAVSANKTLVCTGGAVNLNATGAMGYAWTGGPSTPGYTVNPTAAVTVYTVTGTHTVNNCPATRTIAIAAVIPNVNVTSTMAICDGGTATLTATGANTYTWNGIGVGTTGMLPVQPLANSTYTLIANTQSLTVNCITNHTAMVYVNPNPTINVTPGKNTICKGETHTLTATGAQSYVWSTAATTSVITVKPNSTTIYSVVGTDANNCSGSILYQAKVNNCTAITEQSAGMLVSVFPNPNKGEFSVSAESAITLKLINSIGQEIRSITLNENNGFKFQVKDVSNGVYFLVGENEQGKINQKVIIDK